MFQKITAMNFKDLPFEKAEIEILRFDDDFIFEYDGEPFTVSVPFEWRSLSLSKGTFVEVKKEVYTKTVKGVLVKRGKLVFLGVSEL